MVSVILIALGFSTLIATLFLAFEEQYLACMATLLLGAIMFLIGINTIPKPTHPYPAIPVEKYNAFLQSGHHFYVESNKVYAVKNEVVYLGPASNVVTNVEN